MDKQNVVYTYDEMLLSLRHLNSDTCSNLDEHWGHYDSDTKLVPKRQVLYNSLFELFRLVKERGSGIVVDRGLRENTVLTGIQFQFYRKKKVIKMNGGHSCTTL